MKKLTYKPCACGCGEITGYTYKRGHHPHDYHLSGAACYNWKGDAARPETKRGRAQKAYPLGPCEDCGAPASDRHHIDGDTGNNARENIAILCRRCHMTRDGRLVAFNGLPKPEPKPQPCVNCGTVTSRRWYGRCHKCNEYSRRHGTERPAVLGSIPQERDRAKRAAACIHCGRPCNRIAARPTRGYCASCYSNLRQRGKLQTLGAA